MHASEKTTFLYVNPCRVFLWVFANEKFWVFLFWKAKPKQLQKTLHGFNITCKEKALTLFLQLSSMQNFAFFYSRKPTSVAEIKCQLPPNPIFCNRLHTFDKSSNITFALQCNRLPRTGKTLCGGNAAFVRS